MAFTKVTNVGIASTGTVLLQDVNATGIVTAGLGVSTVDGFFSGVTTTSTLKSTAIRVLVLTVVPILMVLLPLIHPCHVVIDGFQSL